MFLRFAAGIADKFGNGCLDGGGSQGETHCKNGCNQLIDSECFCTNCLCQEYPIEEADDTAGNTGSRHQKGAGNQRIFQESGNVQWELQMENLITIV